MLLNLAHIETVKHFYLELLRLAEKMLEGTNNNLTHMRTKGFEFFYLKKGLQICLLL